MKAGKPQPKWTRITASGTTLVAHGYLKSVPGIGGRIKFSNPVHVVHYSEKGKSPTEPFSMGERMYLRQLSAYLIDQYAIERGNYENSHIAPPLGSFRRGFYYRWAEGSEGFPWALVDPMIRGGLAHITLPEFNKFCGIFGMFGLNVGHDVTDVDDGYFAQNIVVPSYNYTKLSETLKMPSQWTRIDVTEDRSCPFNAAKFIAQVKGSAPEITAALGREKFEILRRYAEYLDGDLSVAGGLKEFVFAYRQELVGTLGL